MGHRFDIAVELARLCARNKDGSFATQDDRAQILHQAARTLQKAGFQNLAATSLKPKHFFKKKQEAYIYQLRQNSQ